MPFSYGALVAFFNVIEIIKMCLISASKIANHYFSKCLGVVAICRTFKAITAMPLETRNSSDDRDRDGINMAMCTA